MPRGSKRRRSESPAPPSSKSSARRGLSVLSTDTEASSTWPSLEASAREKIAKYAPNGRPDEDKLQASLEACLTWFPEGGRESLARDITKAANDQVLHEVYHNLVTGLGAPMKARSTASSVTPSPHLKRQEHVDAVASTLDEPESRDPKFRQLCMKRDGHCCVVTGYMDTGHFENIGCPEGVTFAPADIAHIIPFSYASWDKSAKPSDSKSSAWEVLYRCFPRLRQELETETINDVSNGITLQSGIHEEFGSFHLAFKPTDRDNVYQLKTFKLFSTKERIHLPKSLQVEFKKADDAQDLELPKADYLDCHYRLAEILNASGMAEVIQRYIRDWEDLQGSAGSCLKEDGSTDIGKLLRAGLWERVY